PRAPAPSAPRERAPQAKTCSSSCSSSLHPTQELEPPGIPERFKGQLRGVLECERCGRLHDSGLALDGDFLRRSHCAHRLGVAGSFRQRWRLPETIPTTVVDILEAPEDDGWTLDDASALSSGARWMREHRLRARTH
ncbi:hypothetical protein ACIKT0_19955, partial [Hansschlegelia beijingensis]|uniref:hypothetical protein n=1 Tax=Hansschlegelia beijingensis TaxID=1133344 RepID=UPI00387F1571